VTRFDFEFSRPLSWPLALLGVTPWTAHVDVTDDEFAVRFGPWSLVTPLSNVEDAEVTGPYLPFKVIGPHISLADRGATFGTTWRRGVCVRFRQPVPAALPGGLLRHPGVTVTVADADRLAAVLRQRSDDGDQADEVARVLQPVPDEAGLAEVTASPDVAAPAPAAVPPPVTRRPLKRTTTRTTRPVTPSPAPAPTAAPDDEAGETQTVAALSPRRASRSGTTTAASTATGTSTRARRSTRRPSPAPEPEHPTPADMPKHTSTEKVPGVTPPADEDLPGREGSGS
jgi:hypothetical protein